MIAEGVGLGGNGRRPPPGLIAALTALESGSLADLLASCLPPVREAGYGGPAAGLVSVGWGPEPAAPADTWKVSRYLCWKLTDEKKQPTTWCLSSRNLETEGHALDTACASAPGAGARPRGTPGPLRRHRQSLDASLPWFFQPVGLGGGDAWGSLPARPARAGPEAAVR